MCVCVLAVSRGTMSATVNNSSSKTKKKETRSIFQEAGRQGKKLPLLPGFVRYCPCMRKKKKKERECDKRGCCVKGSVGWVSGRLAGTRTWRSLLGKGKLPAFLEKRGSNALSFVSGGAA